MSQRTTAAVRQNEMNVNITLLTTTICAARPTNRLAEGPSELDDDIEAFLGYSIPASGAALGA
jgi:hypothetical protein